MESIANRTQLDWHDLVREAIEVPGGSLRDFNRFWSYSFLNQILLYSQGARGPVASFPRWKALGRHVRRGEKGMTIIRPITVKREDDEGNEVRLTRFKPVNGAFQYSQTEGEDIPWPELPEWDFKRMLGNLAIKEVPFTQTDGDIHGYSYDRNIAINPVAPNPLGTGLHEVAHVLGDHTTPENLQLYSKHRGVFEAEAELPAYLVGRELGFMTADQEASSRAYCQHWITGQDLPETSIRRVFKTTETILSAGRLAIGGEVEVA
jgi:hypothetical protein